MRKTRRYKRYPISLQESTVERMKLGVNVSELAAQLGVGRTTLYLWKEQSERRKMAPQKGKKLAPLEERDYRIQELENRVGLLEGELGRAELEKSFFERALRRIEESRQKRENDGGSTSSPKSATR
jgi:transposase-like protein